jgi:hypothetical protein
MRGISNDLQAIKGNHGLHEASHDRLVRLFRLDILSHGVLFAALHSNCTGKFSK